jgi:hypothetical protein
MGFDHERLARDTVEIPGGTATIDTTRPGPLGDWTTTVHAPGLEIDGLRHTSDTTDVAEAWHACVVQIVRAQADALAPFATERCRHGAHEVVGEPGHGECRGHVTDPTTGRRQACTCDCHEPYPVAGSLRAQWAAAEPAERKAMAREASKGFERALAAENRRAADR